MEQNAHGKVGSIEKVGDEFKAGGDELSLWAAARGKAFFTLPDPRILPALGQVSSWSRLQNYAEAVISTFLQVADYWVVSHALAHGMIVVTHEVPSESVRKIKIPNACISLGIDCISPYEMLRRERVRFVLARK